MEVGNLFSAAFYGKISIIAQSFKCLLLSFMPVICLVKIIRFVFISRKIGINGIGL